jgi:hypothetical protein
LAFVPVAVPLFAIIVLFVLVIALLVQYWRHMVTNSLTAHFRAAECISEGHLPPQWVKEIERHLRFWRWQRGLQPASIEAGTALAIDKLDRLKQFFATSTVFADAEAKTILMEELDSTRRRWEQMSWEQLRETVPP